MILVRKSIKIEVNQKRALPSTSPPIPASPPCLGQTLPWPGEIHAGKGGESGAESQGELTFGPNSYDTIK